MLECSHVMKNILGTGNDMSYVIFDNVRKVYKAGEVEIEALRGASFTIEKGDKRNSREKNA